MINEFKKYKRTNVAEMRPYIKGEDMTNISVSKPDAERTPEIDMGMIARNPMNNEDQWYVARAYFNDNFELVQPLGGPATKVGGTTVGALKTP